MKKPRRARRVDIGTGMLVRRLSALAVVAIGTDLKYSEWTEYPGLEGKKVRLIAEVIE